MKLTKKLRLFLSLTSLLICMCMFSITASADVFDFPVEEMTTSADDLVKYADGKISLTEIKNLIANYGQQASGISNYSVEEIEFFDEYYKKDTDFYETMLSVRGEGNWGEFVGYDKLDVKETDEEDVIIVSSNMTFSAKEVKLTLTVKVFPNIGHVVTDTAISVLGEEAENAAEGSLKSKLMSATSNTLLGMGTVFVVLILISLIISCFAFIPKIQAMFAKKDKAEISIAKDAQKQDVSVDAQASVDDTELIAVIAAAIAASENTTTDGFVVRSIRRR